MTQTPHASASGVHPTGIEQFRRIGVFQQSNPADDGALRFAGKFAQTVRADALFCIHVRDPQHKRAPNPTLGELDARVRRALPVDIATKAQVAAHLGVGVAEILQAVQQHALDLIIIGKRLPSDELAVGAAFTRLARKSPCSVLIVPDMVSPHLERLLVPIDFSEHSRDALESAVAIARATDSTKAQVAVQSVYCVSYGYSKTGCTLEQASDELGQVTLRKLRKFCSHVDMSGLHADYFGTCSEFPAEAINQLASARKMDLIVLGSRGSASSAVALLGKTTERILMGATLPVLLVKRKRDSGHGILGSIFG